MKVEVTSTPPPSVTLQPGAPVPTVFVEVTGGGPRGPAGKLPPVIDGGHF